MFHRRGAAANFLANAGPSGAGPRTGRLSRPARGAAFACLTALALSAGPAPPAYAEAFTVGAPTGQLDLDVGKGSLLRVDRPAASVFIADPNIADVQIKSSTLVYVLAKAPGSTSLIALDAYDSTIASIALAVGHDVGRLSEALRSQLPGARIQVSALNDAVVLSGVVSSAAEGDDAVQLANLFLPPREGGPSRVINRMIVDAPNQVNLRVRVAEVSRDAARQLGFNWESLASVGDGGGFVGWATGVDIVSGTGSITRPSGQAGAIIAGLVNPEKGLNINVLVDALEQKNLVSILAEPNLTAVSGEPASFLAGGEYPIPVPQGLDQVSIQYKQFGVSLNFVATVLDGGRISLNVRPEVSQLSQTGAITLNGITVPALTTRRAETTVELASGQSFAIAGLLQNSIARDLRRLPGAGDVPILGELFRSRRFQRNQSELVIIVTPYLVQPSRRRLATPAVESPAPAPQTSGETG